MIDYDRVELVPAPNRFLDEAVTAPSPGMTDESLPGQSTATRELAYAQRAAAYEAGLEVEYARIRWGRRRSQTHPEHQVQLPGRTETVVYDATLNRQMLKTYLVHGWAGVQAVQDALQRASSSPRSAALHPWVYATSFFGFTRNLLVLSIREALMEIERKAADRMVLELSLSARLVNESWARLDIRESGTNARGETEDVISDKLSPSWDTPVRRKRIFFTFGNTELANTLYTLVNRAVQARADLAAQIAKYDRLKQAIDDIGKEFAPPVGDVTRLAEIEAWLAEQNKAIEALYAQIHAKCPLVLLSVPLLTVPLARPDMEQTVGECLARFHGESERIAAAYVDRVSKVGALIPGEQPGRSPELLYGADFAPEASVVKAVLDGALKDAGLLAMMSESVLRLLVEHGQVQFDTFEYVVLMHYLTALQAGLIAEQERAQALHTVVAKVSALISMALWLVPAGRVVEGVSTLLGMGTLSFYTYSVVHKLAIVDRQLGLRLAELDRRNAAEVVALTELVLMRPAYLKEMTETVLREVALIGAAGAGPMLRHLLHVREVYLDLETLIGT